MKIFCRHSKKTAELDLYLLNGEMIRIRQLTPAERLRLLPQPDDIAFCRRLALGLVNPKISFKEAVNMLERDPFRAFEIVRAIQKFTAEEDYRKQEQYEQTQNLAFLQQIQAIASLIENSGKPDSNL